MRSAQEAIAFGARILHTEEIRANMNMPWRCLGVVFPVYRYFYVLHYILKKTNPDSSFQGLT